MQLQKIVSKSLKVNTFFKTHSYNLNSQNITPEFLQETLQKIMASSQKMSDKSALHIYLHDNAVGDLGCKILGRVQFTNISRLFLANNKISSKGCRFVSNCYFPQLQEFFFGYNYIGDEGCHYLSKGRWPKLTKLGLESNKITTKGCIFLLKANFGEISIYIIKNDIQAIALSYFKSRLWDQQRSMVLQY